MFPALGLRCSCGALGCLTRAYSPRVSTELLCLGLGCYDENPDHGVCVCILRYREGLPWLLLIQVQSFNQLVQKLQDLANQNLIYQTISSANQFIYSTSKVIISTPYPTLCIKNPRISGPTAKERIQLLFRMAGTSLSLTIPLVPIL